MSYGDTLKKAIKELRRRNFIPIAGIYVSTTWVILQLGAVLENALNLPTWFDTLVATLLVVCFPILLILAWAYSTRPTTNQPQTDNSTKRHYLGRIIGIGMAVVLLVMIFQILLKPDNDVSLTQQIQLSAIIVNQAGEPVTNADLQIFIKDKKLLELPATSDFRGIAIANFSSTIGEMVKIDISANEYQNTTINILVDSQLLTIGNIELNKIKSLQMSKLVHSISADDDLQYIDFFIKNNESDSIFLQKIKLQGVKKKETGCLSSKPGFLISINKQQKNQKWFAHTQNKHDTWSDRLQLYGEIEILPCEQAWIDLELHSLMRVFGNSEDKIRVEFPRRMLLQDGQNYLLEVEKWDSFLVSLISDENFGACQASCRLLLYLCSNFSAQSPHDLRRVIGGPFSAMSKLC